MLAVYSDETITFIKAKHMPVFDLGAFINHVVLHTMNSKVN